jgi:hypothetical protein
LNFGFGYETNITEIGIRTLDEMGFSNQIKKGATIDQGIRQISWLRR